MATWWLLICVFCSCAGWLLSAVHQLNVLGYTVVVALGLATVLVWHQKSPNRHFHPVSLPRVLRRFQQPIPLTFFILSAIAFLGGVIYAPTNYDALAYRVPRTLHWLAEGRWHWVHTIFQRVNVRGCGFEWMMAPLILITRSDRLFFLINFVSFCLLPGLFFSGMRRMGVSGRVAWCWMWILPCGYCYLLQASSLGNDMFGGFFAIAAFVYGLRARQQGRLTDLWLSGLAMAMATGVKANNLPFLAVWAITVAPCWRLLRSNFVGTVAVGIAALLVSFLPIALANAFYGADWTGAKQEGLVFRAPNPLVRLGGNTGMVLLGNLTPPLSPFAGTWNSRVAPRLESPAISRAFGTSVTNPFFEMGELATEEYSGLGLGVCALIIGTACVALRRRNATQFKTSDEKQLQRWVFIGTLIATGALLAISFAKSGARFLDGYYLCLLLPFLLLGGQSHVVRQRWFPGAVIMAALLAALPLLLDPSRPLFPVQAMLRTAQRLGYSGPFLARAQKVYAVYGHRSDSFAPALGLLPAGKKVLGFISFDDPEAALWKPFGSRRVVHVCPDDSAEALRAKNVQYILCQNSVVENFFGGFPGWLVKVNGEIVRTLPLTLRAGRGTETWSMVRLR